MNVHEIEAIHPFGLSNRADCAGPDSDTSPGAQFLASVRDHFVQAAEAEYGEDVTSPDWVHQAADDLVPTYTHERWLVFTDLGAWEEDVTELAGQVDDLTQAAGVALYMIAERLLFALAEELGDDSNDDA